jgi:hypothetical protein
MATQAQIDANRRNAQKSTGPRTPDGKAKSRRNALKIGLSASALMIGGEDSREMAEMGHDYFRMFVPANAFQRFHIENVIYCEWMIRRCRRIEAELLNHLMMKDRSIPYELAAGCAYESDAAGPNALQKIYRRMSSLEKSYHRSLAELEASGARVEDDAPDPNADFEYDPESGRSYYPARRSASEPHPAPEPDPGPEAEPRSESPAAPEALTAVPGKPAAPASPAHPDSTPEIGFVLPNSENAFENGPADAPQSAQSPLSAPAATPAAVPTPHRQPAGPHSRRRRR